MTVDPGAEEVAQVVRRWFRAFDDGDIDTVLNLFAPTDDLTTIGPDPGEHWFGFREAAPLWRVQREQMGTFAVTINDLRTWVRGDVAWAIALFTARFADGPVADLRTSIVLTLDKGQWRFIHLHTSAAAPNEDVLGRVLVTSLDAVVDAVQDEEPELSDRAAADGTVTVLFSDVEGSTERAEDLGDVAWVEALSVYDQDVRRVVEHHGGTVVKAMGDGYMAVFASSRRAIEAALQIASSASLPTRLGLHAGEAVRHREDFFGRTVTTAARVASAACGGEVLVSDLVRQLNAGLGVFEFCDARDAVLKGLDGTHVLYRACWRRPD